MVLKPIYRRRRGGQPASWRCGAFILPLLMLAAPKVADAHDTGFGHSRRTIYLQATPEGLVIEYRIKQGPEEALVEMTLIDRDRDGKLSTAECRRFFTTRAAALVQELELRTAQGDAIPLAFLEYELGHNLTQLYRFTAATTVAGMLLEDRNFAHKPGQVRIVVAENLAAEIAEPIDLTHADRVLLRIVRKQSGSSRK